MANVRALELTNLQLSHAVVAIQVYMDELLRKADQEPEGGEHEDYLVAQSILAVMKKAKQRKRVSGTIFQGPRGL
jgi:hypothetical protein